MFPDFLGIGAQKAGTTWLSANLRRHPEIWLPPLKELHYFNERQTLPFPNLWQRFTDRGNWFNHNWRHRLVKRFKGDLRHPRIQNILWDLRFFFGRRSDRWYASLFKKQPGQIAGEITPGYALINKQTVRHIHDLMPALKLILMVRDPIDRAWSQAVMDLAQLRGRRLNQIHMQEFVDYFESGAAASRQRGSYTQTLETWRSCYPETQLFIGYLDEVRQGPEQLLMRVYRFLGVSDSLSHVANTVGEKVNVGSGTDIPKDFEVFLARMYHDEIHQFHHLVGGYASQWLKRTESLIANDRK